jgi:assimilatory nitrate reductase catalytic subunit
MAGRATTVRTTCPYCGVGCGVLATQESDGAVAIKGDPGHPANFGRLCSKGSALAETLSLDDRLLHPEIGGRRATWESAIDLVATRFNEVIATHGADSVAFYVSGQLLTEDYYVANKLMKGFIGTANIDTNSRLCMASSVAGHRRAFGSDTVPGAYEDLELADLVVLVGSNLAWCHPVLFQRLLAARQVRGTKIVVVDPRRTVTAEAADLHLPIAPGSDVALFNGLLDHLAASGSINEPFVARHTNGPDATLAVARATGRAGAARETGVAEIDLCRFYGLFAGTERVVTVYSQGVNQSSAGTDKVNAIINCHLLTGRIGRPGMGPFSVTGQPNAMGGREVGGLANTLAAHMEIENPDHRRIVQGFWHSPTIASRPGPKAVDLFRAVGDGRIKALWIMATNPVDSLPEADGVIEALRSCPFVVVSDVARNVDSIGYAHVRLPAAAWGEKDGTVTNSERRISRQRAFLTLPGDAKPDWWIVAQVARRMGFRGFDYDGPAAIFREYAALTREENGGTRDLDLGALADVTDTAYATLPPFQWPLPVESTVSAQKRFFAAGGFYTADRRARFVPTPVRRPMTSLDAARPLVLNTGRIRDQWHTMTRTAKSARLMSYLAEPFAEIHPEDAAQLGIAPADLVQVMSAHGSVLVRALVTERQRRGSVFVPMHWTDQLASAARVNALVGSHVDPLSGQPELKHTPVAIRRVAASWYGFAVSACKPAPQDALYWAMAKAAGGWRIELADAQEPADWRSFVVRLLGVDAGKANILSYQDNGRDARRFAAFDGARLLGVLFVAPQPVQVSRSWAAEQLSRCHDAVGRLSLLAGRGGEDTPDPGAMICACLSVGANQIASVVAAGAVTVEAVGDRLKAGTSCGSCRTEIRRLIDAHRLQEAV